MSQREAVTHRGVLIHLIFFYLCHITYIRYHISYITHHLYIVSVIHIVIKQVQHVAGTEEWRLVLQPVEKTDHGWYSCQVGTLGALARYPP